MTDRESAAQATPNAYQILLAIMDSIDALVYVADMNTHELLFANRYVRDNWGDVIGTKCWQSLQNGQTGPCPFCTNDRLLDAAGQPTKPYQWEFQNTRNAQWYDCRDTALRWIDGRIVRLEVATDITERKRMEDELRRLAISDSLTGLFNRRHFFELAQLEYERFRRYSHPLALIMADIDHFKAVNDQYGHLIGDQVLQAVADTLQRNLRQVDILGRYGGEEFAMALPETDTATARALAERLRTAIADRVFATGQGPLALTLSLGVAAVSDRASIDFEHLLDAADRMLYQAKLAGRNRVMTWDAETKSTP